MPFRFERKPELVAYVTCGDPDLATTRDIVLAMIRAGAAVIELGVPFSDPVADGPVIQRASERALKHGTSLEQVLKLAAEIREQSQSVGLIVFTYLNPILRMGLEKFCKIARLAGVDGVLVTDLPVEEATSYLDEMEKNELAPIFLAAPTSTDDRLKRIAAASNALVRRLRKRTKLPIAVGFGISTAEQFAAVGGYADAAVVGSAIVDIIERNPRNEAQSVAEFVGRLLAGSS
jgi:tryptophan synthase alpha chain